jgi:selenide,water dikinase
LSDVYAMGGKPLTALNIVCFPIKELDKSVLRSIIEGAQDVISQTEAVMVGGHSVEDKELKYGLSVTGIVHPNRIITNAGAKPGDKLVLTKPLGTGILAKALKARKLDNNVTSKFTELMASLNKAAAEVITKVGVNACTDITGFGLFGHALKMAEASKVGMRIHARKVPVITEAITFASMGMIPLGSRSNKKFCSDHLDIDQRIDPLLIHILSDAQTSGGLLISVPEEKADSLIRKLIERNTPAAHVIGEILTEPIGVIQVR